MKMVIGDPTIPELASHRWKTNESQKVTVESPRSALRRVAGVESAVNGPPLNLLAAAEEMIAGGSDDDADCENDELLCSKASLLSWAEKIMEKITTEKFFLFARKSEK